MMSTTARICRLMTLSLLTLGLLAGPGRAEAAQRVRVKLGTLAPRGSKWLESIERMGRRWKEVSGGTVQLKIYPGGVAGDESDMVRKMRIGQLQAATITNLGLGSIDRALVALQVPMMFRSYDELDYVRAQLGVELAERLEAKGFVVLDWGDAGWVHFFAKSKAITPTEMQKLKMFVWSGDPQSEAAWRAAGFDVIPTANSDVLQSLQTGRLEAFANVPLYALASQWFALTPHMVAVDWAPLSGATVVEKAVWDKIDPELQQQLKAIAVEETQASRAEIRSLGERAIKAMTDRGLEVHQPDEAAVSAWQATARSAYPAIRGEVVPEEWFDRVQKLVEDYRKSKKGS